MAVFQSLPNNPFVSDMLIMCVIISIKDGSISLSSSVEMMSSSQDLFFIDIISFWTSSIMRGEKHFNCGMSLICGLNFSIMVNWSLIFCIFQWKNLWNHWQFFTYLFSNSGFKGLLLVMLLTTENSCLESLLQSNIFLVIACHLWYTVSWLHMFLSLV